MGFPQAPPICLLSGKAVYCLARVNLAAVLARDRAGLSGVLSPVKPCLAQSPSQQICNRSADFQLDARARLPAQRSRDLQHGHLAHIPPCYLIDPVVDSQA